MRTDFFVLWANCGQTPLIWPLFTSFLKFAHKKSESWLVA
nr:MAG TPA: hypothetical protein [Caudoviricetes sp.]